MTQPTGEMPTTTPAGDPASVLAPNDTELKAELQRIRDALKAANSEAADRRKKLEAYEAAEAKRKEAEMTEVQKAEAARLKAEEMATQAIAQANAKLTRAAFMAEASKYGVVRPEDAYALAIADGAEVKVNEDSSVSGVSEAVKALVEAGRLPRTGAPGAPPLDGGSGSSTPPGKTVSLSPEEHKLAAMAGMTDQQYIDYKNMASSTVTPSSMSDMGGEAPGG